MEPNELKEAQSDFDEGLDADEERNRRIRALELDPDWFDVAKHHDAADFAVLMNNIGNNNEDIVEDHIDRMVKSWATWVVDSQNDKR